MTQLFAVHRAEVLHPEEMGVFSKVPMPALSLLVFGKVGGFFSTGTIPKATPVTTWLTFPSSSSWSMLILR